MAMLPRAARPALVASGFSAPIARQGVAAAAGFHSSAVQQQTLRELEQRIKSVKNIEKITKVIRHLFVAVRKSAGVADSSIGTIVDEDDCVYEAHQGSACHAGRQGVRPGQQRWVSQFCNNGREGWRKRGETDRRLSAEVFEQSEATAPDGGRELYIVCSSDKGLCGGIHSSVSKRAKAEFGKHGGAAASADSTEGPSIVVLGDKAKAQLSRTLGKNIAVSFNQVGKDVPTFAEASAIADKIVSSGIKFDKVRWLLLRSPLSFLDHLLTGS